MLSRSRWPNCSATRSKRCRSEYSRPISAPTQSPLRAAASTPRGALEEISPELLAKYFTRVDDAFQIKKRIRKSPGLRRVRPGAARSVSLIDLVLCRNVLIYFTKLELQQRRCSCLHSRCGPTAIWCSENRNQRARCRNTSRPFTCAQGLPAAGRAASSLRPRRSAADPGASVLGRDESRFRRAPHAAASASRPSRAGQRSTAWVPSFSTPISESPSSTETTTS